MGKRRFRLSVQRKTMSKSGGDFILFEFQSRVASQSSKPLSALPPPQSTDLPPVTSPLLLPFSTLYYHPTVLWKSLTVMCIFKVHVSYLPFYYTNRI